MGILDQLIPDITPKFNSAKDLINAGFERVISRLDVIHADLEEEDFSEVVRYVGPILVTATTTGEADISVGPGDQWKVTKIIMMVATPATVSSMRISDGTHFRYARAITGDFTDIGFDTILGGGTKLLFTAGAADVTIQLECLMKIRAPAKLTQQSGQIVQSPDSVSEVPDPRQETFTEGRHETPLVFGPNIIGERTANDAPDDNS